MRENVTYRTTFLTSGIYIGDPSYGLQEDVYEAWGNKKHYEDGVISVRGINNDQLSDFVVVGTKEGDGDYDSDSHQSFYVCAGCICIADINACDPRKLKENSEITKIVKFNKLMPVQIMADYDEGIITFEAKSGSKILEHICINTNRTEEYEDEEEYDEYYEDDEEFEESMKYETIYKKFNEDMLDDDDRDDNGEMLAGDYLRQVVGADSWEVDDFLNSSSLGAEWDEFSLLDEDGQAEIESAFEEWQNEGNEDDEDECIVIDDTPVREKYDLASISEFYRQNAIASSEKIAELVQILKNKGIEVQSYYKYGIDKGYTYEHPRFTLNGIEVSYDDELDRYDLLKRGYWSKIFKDRESLLDFLLQQ